GRIVGVQSTEQSAGIIVGGFCPQHHYIEMYEAYHELGGNGMVTKMYEEIRKLHLEKKGD
ncbi:MAG: hypothetical protein ACI4UH_03725, partial [Dorea sp.]